MPSPFPGMDPYLERHWRDVHGELISLSRTALNKSLPNDLVARMEERVVIDRVHYDRVRAIYPDVRVYEDPNRSDAPLSAAVMDAPAEPVILSYEAEEHTETYITILDSAGGELLTVIEFLSPANKLPGDGRHQYRRKRDELWEGHVNVVEIDLVRAGQWRELLSPLVAPARVETAYRTIVYRAQPQRRVELFPIALQGRLPAIPIALRPADPIITLNLQSLVEQVYQNGRYDSLDYARPCEPALEGDDAAWADELLRATKKR